jgi:predicted nucleic acid-binding protein
VIYLDTSALLKLYIIETGSESRRRVEMTALILG